MSLYISNNAKSAQIVVSGVMRVILTISIVVWVVQLCTNPTRSLKGASLLIHFRFEDLDQSIQILIYLQINLKCFVNVVKKRIKGLFDAAIISSKLLDFFQSRIHLWRWRRKAVVVLGNRILSTIPGVRRRWK
jgi:hypothetical protein